MHFFQNNVSEPAAPQFKDIVSLNERRAHFLRISMKHPDRIPIILEAHSKHQPFLFKQHSDTINLSKSKYLVPRSITMGNFIKLVRSRIVIDPSAGMFFFVNNTLIPNNATMESVYLEHKDDDGFLYIKYSGESAFGWTVKLFCISN